MTIGEIGIVPNDTIVPKIEITNQWWILIPLLLMIAAIPSHVLWFINFIHVFGGILWTGTDLLLSIITTTAGWYMAEWLGFFNLPFPTIWWLISALTIVAILTIQGLGILLPTNLKIYFEMRKEKPDGQKIQKLMKVYVRVVALQGLMQIGIIIIMSRFATGI